ncbi:hypothetical protein OTU49_005663, partial [Cherax quadricarinatus]
FAFVHIFTKVGSGEVYLTEREDKEEEEEEEAKTVVACTVLSLGLRESNLIKSGPNGVGNLPRASPLPWRPALPPGSAAGSTSIPGPPWSSLSNLTQLCRRRSRQHLRHSCCSPT